MVVRFRRKAKPAERTGISGHSGFPEIEVANAGESFIFSGVGRNATMQRIRQWAGRGFWFVSFLLIGCQTEAYVYPCPNGKLEPGEECEPGMFTPDEAAQLCLSRGYSGGAAGCSPQTCQWDTTSCVSSNNTNNQVLPSECDPLGKDDGHACQGSKQCFYEPSWEKPVCETVENKISCSMSRDCNPQVIPNPVCSNMICRSLCSLSDDCISSGAVCVHQEGWSYINLQGQKVPLGVCSLGK